MTSESDELAKLRVQLDEALARMREREREVRRRVRVAVLVSAAAAALGALLYARW